MKDRRRPWFSLVLLLILTGTKAQSQTPQTRKIHSAYFAEISTVTDASGTVELTFPQFYTSVVVVPGHPAEGSVMVIPDTGEPPIHSESKPVCDREGFPTGTPLLVFRKPAGKVRIQFETYTGTLTVLLFYAPPVSDRRSMMHKRTNPCSRPEMISYTEWRQGLPAPKPPRETTVTEHLVIHHSAGSNSNTDYLNTVRNIYLLHTQSNGWDDIGYNFLIAPDGTAFLGRDPQGAGDEDNILGAHFCGKNQNTMGICLLGDFMQGSPGQGALNTLTYLMAWKLNKDRLNPQGSSIHPKGGGTTLPVICGHRDGCSTDCPGDSLYRRISWLRAESGRIADSCKPSLEFSEPSVCGTGILYPNPASGTINVRAGCHDLNGLTVFETTGKPVTEFALTNGHPLCFNLTKGLYYCILKYRDGSRQTIKILIQ